MGSLITLPLSEEQASLMAEGGVEAVKPLSEQTVSYTHPLSGGANRSGGSVSDRTWGFNSPLAHHL